MILNYIWPFGPSQEPKGAGQKYAIERPIHVSNSHTKFGWISTNGLGGDRVMDGRTDWHPCLQMATYVANNWYFDTLVAKISWVSSHLRSCLKLHKST